MRWYLAFCVVALLAFSVNAGEPCPCAADVTPKPMPGPGVTVIVNKPAPATPPAPPKAHPVAAWLKKALARPVVIIVR